MHNDAWATDSYTGPGTAWFGLEECAPLAFDSLGRLVALCGNRGGVAGGVGDPLDLDGEIANSIAADDSGVYLVTTEALVKVALDGDARPAVIWQRPYENTGEHKPGQLSAGSGTTPSVLPSGLVAITDNAEPRMHVQFHDAADGRLVCKAAVFTDGASATDNSLVAVGPASVVVENNHGYRGPWSTMAGRAAVGGLATVGWRSGEVAPTSVAKVSLETGLAAIDARTGETAFSVSTRHPAQQPLRRGDARSGRIGVRRHAGWDVPGA